MTVEETAAHHRAEITEALNELVTRLNTAVKDGFLTMYQTNYDQQTMRYAVSQLLLRRDF